MIVETNISEYAFTAIFLIITKEKKVHLATFHSYSFKAMELNYNIYGKEFLAIFEAFCTWYHYLKGLECSINIIIDHKNLEYFLTTKILYHCQARWSEFLSQFNLIIWFCLEHLGLKLDTITYREDLYPREEKAVYNSVNLQNMCSVFTHSQLITSLWVMVLVSSKPLGCYHYWP